MKKIAVFGVKDESAGSFVFRVNAIETQRDSAPKARVVLEVKNASGAFESKEILLKAGDDLMRKTKNEKYSDLMVNDVNANYNRVELSDGKYYDLEAVSENKEAIFRTQIRETIKAHMDKQKVLGDQIKVLSLFFIDAVKNYVPDESIIRRLFIEEFNRLKGNYDAFKNLDASEVHKGYFATKKEK